MVDSSAPAADVEAVARLATEYFQSWFAGDGERMRACPAPFVEYLHLARFGEPWLIVNALYYVLM